MRQYPVAGGNAIIQSPIVDPKTGMLTWQATKWWQDMQARVQSAITPAGVIAPDAGGSTFVRQLYPLGSGTLASQTNMTVSPGAVTGANENSLIVANFVGFSAGQPFFISIGCWWNTTLGEINIELSNNSDTLSWNYEGMSLSIGVLV